jgi:hypothetical protein
MQQGTATGPGRGHHGVLGRRKAPVVSDYGGGQAGVAGVRGDVSAHALALVKKYAEADCPSPSGGQDPSLLYPKVRALAAPL